MPISDLITLLAAGLLGGVVNSLAGGGSFITFPTLLFVGVPPIAANASNTFAACAGYISGTWALRSEFTQTKSELLKLTLISAVGGGVGAYLLTQTSDTEFRGAIPWLLLFATVIFIFGNQMNATLQRWATKHKHASVLQHTLLMGLFIGVSIYGGFFNAGLGIITLSYLSLAGFKNINEMNALKLLYSSSISLCAIVLFIWNDLIVWPEMLTLLVGTLIGGYLAGHLSRKLPQMWVRRAIIVASTGITAYFFFLG